VEGEEREGSDAEPWLQNTLLHSTLLCPFFAGRRGRRRIIITDGSVGPDFECDGTRGVFVQFCITVMSDEQRRRQEIRFNFRRSSHQISINHSWQRDLFVLYAGTQEPIILGLWVCLCRADDPAERRSTRRGEGRGKGKEAKESILATKLMLSAEDWTESNRIISCWAVYVLEPGLCCGLLGLNCGSAGPWQF
jgi:hypothetical protein